VKAKPSILNSDPYGVGWYIKIKPDNWEADKADLVTGDAAVQKYTAFLTVQGIDCSARAGGLQPGASGQA